VILSWTLVDWLYFHMWRMLFAKLIGRIALFTCENIARIEFYLQGLLPKILAICTIIYFMPTFIYYIALCLSNLNLWSLEENLKLLKNYFNVVNDFWLSLSFEMLKESSTQKASLEHIYVLPRKSIRLEKVSCRQIQAP